MKNRIKGKLSFNTRRPQREEPECETCDDTGTVMDTARVGGEAFDADLVEVPCPDCQ